MSRVVKTFNGTARKVYRLGLRGVLEELRRLVGRFGPLNTGMIYPDPGKTIQESVQTRLSRAGWTRHRVGRGYWKKSLTIDGVEVSLGTRVQLNRRNGLNARDAMTVEVVGLANKITSGAIDVGALVVAGDRLAMRLGRRVPSFSDAVEAVERCGMTDLPLVVIGVEADRPGAGMVNGTRQRNRRHIAPPRMPRILRRRPV